jgi:hypothetical protein
MKKKLKSKDKKILCFDLDNVICSTDKNNNYKLSKPNQKVIEFINQLHAKGHLIKIFTARFMGRNNDNVKKAYSQGYKFTSNQLKSWGLKYDSLQMGKPSYDIFVDDKSIFYKRTWMNHFEKKLKSL